MASQAAKAQTAEANVNNLLMTMGAKVDEAVSSSIAALLHTGSHAVAGVLETSMAIQELEFAFDQAVFSALERGSLAESEARRLTSAVNISKDLAQLGVLAANLGRKVSEVGKHHEHEDFSRLQPWPSLSLIFADRRCVRWRVSIRCWPAAPPWWSFR